MARLIAKFGYMKPNKRNRSGFVEYIAKRDGVIKNLQSFAHKSITNNQSQLIEKLLVKFPKMRESAFYLKHQESQTIGSASELITHIEESSLQELSNMHEYVQYIAQRPRVVKEETHGLFSIHDEYLILEHVKLEVQNHPSNIWTAILSVKREDAIRLGYDNLNLWKSLIRSKQNEVAKHLKIDPDNFKWYAAFHDEAHHPHVHMVMYAKDGQQGYLNQTSMNGIRSAFAREIFKDDLLHIYQKQTQARDDLKLASKEYIQEQIQNINQQFNINPKVEKQLITLSQSLQTLAGKHQYGYLPKPLKKQVDDIVDELSSVPQVQELFDLWYQQRQEVLNMYSSKHEEIRHLSDLNEFKTIKNTIIKLAKEINTNRIHQNTNVSIPIASLEKDNQLTSPQFEVESEVLEDFTNPQILESISSTHNSTRIQNAFDEKSLNVNDHPIVLNQSLKLLYHVSKLFESSMIQRAHKYQVDHKLILKIRKQKIALGQHENDTHKN